MSMSEQIRQKIEEHLCPVHLEVINESHLHAGHAGDDGSGESHFKLIVVSPAFDGDTRVQRSRKIHNLLKDEIKHQIHALSLQLYTPDQYNEK